jgi:hypothetical protein
LATFVGCPAGSDLGTAPASGTVTLDGAPVEGARVTFSPKAADGKAAVGMTDSSGDFTLTTDGTAEGALPGSYTVTIAKTGGGAGTVDPRSGGGQMSPEEAAKFMEQVKEMATAKQEDLLPEKYKSPATSGLTAEVKAGQDNTFPFDLTSQ